MSIEIRPVPAARTADILVPIATAFGLSLPPQRVDQMRALPELEVRLGAFEGEIIVGAAGSYTFEMTVPGNVAVETAGLTIVAVLPTHRRRGILRSLMRRHLDDAHRRGQSVAALFASEGGIYGRFGYGMASLAGDIEVPRDRTAFVGPPAPACRARLVGEGEATAVGAEIWERVRLGTPGMLSRSEAWWRLRRTGDPEALRGGRPALQRAIVEIDGKPAAYALYRFAATVGHRDPGTPIEIVEAVGASPEATRAVWRYLFDIDIAASFRCMLLPPDHPLMFMMAEPRRLSMRLSDALWVRLVDVGAALAQRGYGAEGRLVIEVTDDFCPWNTGRYRVEGGAADRTDESPDVAVTVDALGAAYLGGFTFSQLALAGRAVERSPGGLRRADVLFRGERLPWCPEIF